MRHNFKSSLHGSAAASKSVEKDPAEEDPTTPYSTSPPRVFHFYQQHITDYIYLFMGEGGELTLRKDQAAPLIVEVAILILFSSFYFLTHLMYHPCPMSYTI